MNSTDPHRMRPVMTGCNDMSGLSKRINRKIKTVKFLFLLSIDLLVKTKKKDKVTFLYASV